MKPPMLRSNPKLAEHSHEGESRDYNIPNLLHHKVHHKFITDQVQIQKILLNHKRDHQSSLLQRK